MPKILIPVDASEQALKVIAAVIKRNGWYKAPAEIHLLNVQHAAHQDVAQFVNHEELQKFHREEGLKALLPAKAALAAAGLEAELHVLINDRPDVAIVHFAREKGFDEICMGSHGRGTVSQLLLGSVAADVARSTDIPVTLVR